MSDFPQSFGGLVDTISKLRDPDTGCPSDQGRTSDKTLSYIQREGMEFCDASDEIELSKEAGDIIFNVVFLAIQLGFSVEEIEIAERLFTTREGFKEFLDNGFPDDVSEVDGGFLSKLFSDFIALCESMHFDPILAVKRVVRKMVYRHPYVFEKPRKVELEEAIRVWQSMKKREKVEESRKLNVDFVKRGGKVPVFLQSKSGEVVVVFDIDSDGLQVALRDRLIKGHKFVRVFVDCDQDALIFEVENEVIGSDFVRINSVGDIFKDDNEVKTVCVQDKESGKVLIVGYTNVATVSETLSSGKAVLWSTSRNVRWMKGEGSGETLNDAEVFYSPSSGVFVYKVKAAKRGACHTINLDLKERGSCFYREVDDGSNLKFLEE